MFRCAAVVVVLALLSTSAAAAFRDLPRCHSVPECVALAERNPDTFTPTLKEQLEKQSGATLVAGLTYTHPRPEVNSRIRRLLMAALERCDGHTPESAQTLLDLAEAADVPGQRSAWLDLLARDKAGRPVLVAFIDKAPKNERRFEAMLAYVAGAGVPTSSENDAAIENGTFDIFASPAVPPEVQPIVARYADEIWGRYLALRSNPERNPNTLADLLDHVWSRPEYLERQMAFLRADVTAGRVPNARDVQTLALRSYKRRPDILREMLTWTESATPAVRHVLSTNLLEALVGEPGLVPADYPRVRRMIITGALDPEQPDRKSFPSFLLDYLDGLSAEEARQVAQIAAAHVALRDGYDDELLVRISQPYPEYRPPLLARLTGDDLKEVARIVALASKSVTWPREVAMQWFRDVTPEALRDEAVQERFLILVRLLPDGSSTRLDLPKSRRARVEIGGYRCYLGPVMAYHAAVENRDDRAAFGLPPPAKTPREQVPEAGRPGHYEQIQIPAAPPLTPQEATVRWQHFVLAREAILRHLPKP